MIRSQLVKKLAAENKHIHRNDAERVVDAII